MNLHYNSSRRNNPFVTVLGLDAKLELDTLSEPINNYQPAIARHNSTSEALTNARASEDKQVNLHWTPKPWHEVEDKVLLSTKNINIKNVSPKMKPL